MRGFIKAGVIAGAAVCGTKLLLRARRRFEVRGRVVLVTGGSRGLGLAIAREYAIRGARLALLARDEGELARAQRLLIPAEVRTYVCDVSDGAQIRDAVAEVQREMGEVDVLVNNAGMITNGPEAAMSEGDYELAMRINFEGPHVFIRTLLPFMRGRGSGRIVNIASIGGLVPVPHEAAYSASKHALVGLSQAVRAELTGHGVYVTTVCPGLINNGAAIHAFFKGRADEEYKWFSAASSSAMAVDPVVLARKIVDASVFGDAMLIYPRSAYIQSVLYHFAPGIAGEIMGVVNRVGLPRDDRNDGLRRGAALASSNPEQAEAFAIGNSAGVAT